jgi:2-phosphoglycerate kinase
MAKLFVIESEGTKVPFLRGILTRSLQDAGLGFEEAYDYASKVRDALSDEPEIPSWDLRRLVVEHLRKGGEEDVAQRYTSGVADAKTVKILGDEGQLDAFSVDLHSKSLEMCGIGAEDARYLSRMLGRHLAKRGRMKVSKSYLGRLTYRMLARETDGKTAQRYLVWRQFKRSGRPLLLLIGGTAGSGKSTLATELASRLDIFRTQSTDMLREIMRAMLPERLLPILHRSSFEAWRVLPETSGPMDFEDKIAHGYRGQTDLVSVLCEAVVQRAVRESVSMVLEGVHIDATTVKRLRESDDIIVVPVMLAILKQEVWRKRIRGRGRAANQRRAQRYLKSFETIWQLQSHLLSEADGEDISIVVNDDRESTIAEVLRIIGDTLSAVLEPTVKKVFPANA